jgi:hypothetical protein
MGPPSYPKPRLPGVRRPIGDIADQPAGNACGSGPTAADIALSYPRPDRSPGPARL